MSDFNNKLAERIINSEGYKNHSGFLFDSYIDRSNISDESLERKKIKKILVAAQIFYHSDDSKIRKEGANILSMVIDVFAKKYPDIVPIANSVFTSSGDFPNNKLLKIRYPEVNFEYNFYTEAQADFRYDLNMVEELDFPLTDFQRLLWDDLVLDKDVITVAPTSAGKTHIILNYLMNRIISSDGSFAAIIVPTRALISEVSGKIYELAKDRNCEQEIEICTIPKDGRLGNKTFFVMTQERLHEILQRGDISFDYLFIDEAHNISDENRGVLLHLTIEKVLESSLPQIIIGMPSSSYQNSFSTIFKGVEFTKEITKHSPVAKLIISVGFKGREMILSRHESSDRTVIPKGFTGKKIADIVLKLGIGQSNIIYQNQTHNCENVAKDIAERMHVTVGNQSLEEAADYVEKFVHEEFTLADNLRKGVAFHYSPLPSSIRTMIENLVKNNEIKFIVCTSTLAEGVNLPAKNLFLKNPSQPIPYEPTQRIEDVKLKNITGRAGRMLHHFSGNIFLIEPEDWQFKDYFDEADKEENKIPTFYKTLNEELDVVVSALQGDFSHDDKDQYRFYTIANKLIREYSTDALTKTLNADELSLSTNQCTFLEEKIKFAYENLKVAAFTLEANPTVGYIQQNKLFNFLNEEESFGIWLLPHPNSTDLYNILLRVCKKLVEFGLYLPTENYSLEFICLITKKWIQGDSLKSIISDQIDWDKIHVDNWNVNKSVRNVIKVINNDIRFRLSNSLRCYNLLLSNILENKGLDENSLKLHSYIETGACEGSLINLINMGLSREAAIDINNFLSNDAEELSAVGLLSLYNNGELDKIHNVTAKELLTLLS